MFYHDLILSKMSLEIIKQNAMAIREASKVYEELCKNKEQKVKLEQVKRYMLKLAYNIQQHIDAEKQNVT